MNRRLRAIAVAFGISGMLAAGIAVAQPQPSPMQPRPLGQPQPFPGRPVGPNGLARPSPFPPSPGAPNRVGPGGLQRPPRGFPPGGPQHAGPPPGSHRATHPAAAAHEEEGAGHGGHEVCAGHGPEDPPPDVNWWRGLLWVDNERAESPSFVNQLLFRYQSPTDHCDPKNQPPPFLATLLNFGVVAFVFYRFGRKPIAEALIKRKQAITAEIDTATKLLEDAEDRLDDYEERLDNLADKVKEVRAEFAAQATAEKEHVLAEAAERRVRMRRDAEFRIEQELKTARAELLRDAVVNAVVAAEDLVTKSVNHSDLDRMADDYLKSISGALAGGSRIAGERA